jgi:hypothetical protein
MAYCDFCPCDDCKNGAKWISHAKTVNNNWICDVCYLYNVCAAAKHKQGILEPGSSTAPCENMNCTHRPKLVSGWIK